MANSVDPYQTPQNAASDLGLHCFPLFTLACLSQYFGYIQYEFNGDNFHKQDDRLLLKMVATLKGANSFPLICRRSKFFFFKGRTNGERRNYSYERFITLECTYLFIYLFIQYFKRYTLLAKHLAKTAFYKVALCSLLLFK